MDPHVSLGDGPERRSVRHHRLARAPRRAAVLAAQPAADRGGGVRAAGRGGRGAARSGRADLRRRVRGLPRRGAAGPAQARLPGDGLRPAGPAGRRQRVGSARPTQAAAHPRRGPAGRRRGHGGRLARSVPPGSDGSSGRGATPGDRPQPGADRRPHRGAPGGLLLPVRHPRPPGHPGGPLGGLRLRVRAGSRPAAQPVRAAPHPHQPGGPGVRLWAKDLRHGLRQVAVPGAGSRAAGPVRTGGPR